MAKNKIKDGTKEIRFLLSPTGVFGLAYNADDVAVLNEDQAAELVNAGYARYTDDADQPETNKLDVKAFETENTQLKEAVKGYVSEIENLKKVIEDRDAEIKKFRFDLDSTDSVVNGQAAQIESLKKELSEKQAVIATEKPAALG